MAGLFIKSGKNFMRANALRCESGDPQKSLMSISFVG